MISPQFPLLTFLLGMMLLVSQSEELRPTALEWFRYDENVWVFGSYWDHRPRSGDSHFVNLSNPPHVRLLLVGPFGEGFENELKGSRCEYFYDDFVTESTSNFVVGVHAALWDSYDRNEEAQPYYVYCKPEFSGPNFPKAVSLHMPSYTNSRWYYDTMGKKRVFSYWIRGSPVPIPVATPSRPSIMACLKPLHSGPFLSIEYIIQYLVFYDIMGVKHFIMFDMGSNTPNIYKLLNIARCISSNRNPCPLKSSV